MTWPPLHVPRVVDTDWNFTPSGSGSLICTLCATLGPLFLTVIVYVSWSPSTSGSGLSVLVICRSITGAGRVGGAGVGGVGAGAGGVTGGAGGAGVTGGGGGGGTALTVTDAVSRAVTAGPATGGPVAVAVFTNDEPTLASEQV